MISILLRKWKTWNLAFKHNTKIWKLTWQINIYHFISKNTISIWESILSQQQWYHNTSGFDFTANIISLTDLRKSVNEILSVRSDICRSWFSTKLSFFGQLDRSLCHWVSEWVSLSVTFWFQCLQGNAQLSKTHVTSLTTDPRDDEARYDQLEDKDKDKEEDVHTYKEKGKDEDIQNCR